MAYSQTSKELVRQLFSGAELSRIPFIPWVFGYAARLEQVPVRKMLTDPGLLARSLQNAQRLFGYDAVVYNFDSTLEAEACGCHINWGGERDLPSISGHCLTDLKEVAQLDASEFAKRGRLPVVVEAARRLKVTSGRTVAQVGVVTGPLALATYLGGANIAQELAEKPEETREILGLAAQVVLKVCRIFCELEPDVIVIADEQLTQLPPKYMPDVLPVFNPIWNLIRFYNAQPVLLGTGYPAEGVEGLFSLGAEGVVVASNKGNLPELKRSTLRYGCVTAVTIPSHVLRAPMEELREHLMWSLGEAGDKRGLFLSTEWEVPCDMPPENMHEIMKAIASTGT